MIGSIANNRFLHRVNPEIKRALTDSGSSLEHPEIQQLMRQMVDLGIADNLKLWVHSGLVKTRTSGSDLFVSKAYDISGEENDGVQATEANQPKLVSDGMEFDGINDWIIIPEILISPTHIGMGGWFKCNNTSGEYRAFSYNNTKPYVNFRFNQGGTANRLQINILSSTTEHTLITTSFTLTNWLHVFITASENGTGYLYINGTEVDSDNTIGTFEFIDLSGQIRNVIGANRNINSAFLSGLLNDIRIFNSALSATEIEAIYNQSKGFYGIT